MFEFDGRCSEVNDHEIKSHGVNETSFAETGGEASEATKEETNEQANKVGGFNDEPNKSMHDNLNDPDLFKKTLPEIIHTRTVVAGKKHTVHWKYLIKAYVIRKLNVVRAVRTGKMMMTVVI